MKNEKATKRQAVGASAESIVEWSHALGRGNKEVCTWKAPTPLQIIKELGKGEVLCRKERKSGVDYYGVLKGGRAFMAECKSCNKANFPLSNIESHQVEFLDECEKMGASCWLVVVWTPDSIQAKEALRKITAMPTVLVPLPWSKVSELITGRRPSVPWETMIEHAKPTISFYAKP